MVQKNKKQLEIADKRLILAIKDEKQQKTKKITTISY